jgi:hypothetical protein
MNRKMPTLAMFALTPLLVPMFAAPSDPTDPSEALQARVESLRAPNVAWRKIAWKSCLLEGLKAAREQKKPALLWVFIDRPVNDARC